MMNREEKEEQARLAHNRPLLAEAMKIANETLKGLGIVTLLYVLKDTKTEMFYAYKKGGKLWVKDWKDAKFYKEYTAKNYQEQLNRKSKGKLEMVIENHKKSELWK